METGAEIHQGSRHLPSNRKGSGLEHQAAVEDIGVAVRNIGKCGHGTSLYSVVSISLVGSGGSSSEFTSPPQLFAAAAPIYAASSGQIALRAG
jgi:hypothetical protein